MSRVVHNGIVLALSVGGLFCAVGVLSACSGVSVPSELSIRTAVGEVVYQGRTYKPTGTRVGIERISPDNLSYAGPGFPPGTLPSEMAGTSYSGSDVYTIAGIDSQQAVAVKFAAAPLSGEGASYYVWMRYEREQ